MLGLHYVLEQNHRKRQNNQNLDYNIEVFSKFKLNWKSRKFLWKFNVFLFRKNFSVIIIEPIQAFDYYDVFDRFDLKNDVANF